MKRFARFFILAIAMIFPVKVQAAVFFSESSVFADHRDGVWSFPEKKAWAEPPEGSQEKLAEFSFENGVPLELYTSGIASITQDFLRINASSAPSFLVMNSMRWALAVDQPTPLWLELEYRVWSEETERGFDDPMFVVYSDGEVVHTEGVFEYCPPDQRVENECFWQKRRWFVGESEGERTFALFAGDMGDVHKPSGVDIRSISLWQGVTNTEDPLTPVFLTSEQSSFVSAPNSREQSPTLVEKVTERYREAPHTVQVETAREKGAILGATDQAVKSEGQNSTQARWRQILPWFLGGFSLLFLVIGLYLWRKGQMM